MKLCVKCVCQNTIFIQILCCDRFVQADTSNSTDFRKYLYLFVCRLMQNQTSYGNTFFNENENNDVKMIIFSNITNHITIAISVKNLTQIRRAVTICFLNNDTMCIMIHGW